MQTDSPAPEDYSAQDMPPEAREQPEMNEEQNVDTDYSAQLTRRQGHELTIAVKVATIVATLFTVSAGTSVLLLEASLQRLLLVIVCFESLLLVVLLGTWIVKKSA